MIQEAIELTSIMEFSCPEIYQFLDETPLDISTATGNDITTVDMELYLETLKNQMLNYSDAHPEQAQLLII